MPLDPRPRMSRPEARATAYALFARGWSAPRIARELGRSVRTIRYWKAEARAALSAMSAVA